MQILPQSRKRLLRGRRPTLLRERLGRLPPNLGDFSVLRKYASFSVMRELKMAGSEAAVNTC
jgi:hypothetical protein